MDHISQLAFKSQTLCGAIHFVLFLGSWPTIIGLLKNFLDKDRLTFNCIPKPSDVIKQLCYGDYISTVSPLLVPLDFAYITCGILGFFWASFFLYSGFALWRIKKAEKEQQRHLKECRARRFMWSFLFHVCCQLVVLAVMLGLFCRFQTIHLPVVYKCSQRNNTQIPTNQVEITCNDLHHSQKSKLNIGVIAIMALSIVLCLFSIIHLYLTRQNFLQQLPGDSESHISIGDSGNMANQQQQVQSAGDEVDASRPGCPWSKNVMDLSNFQNVFGEIQRHLDPERPFGGDYRSLASLFGMKQSDITYLGSRPNPTEIILTKYNPKLHELRRHLLSEEMNRPEVVEVIKEWVETNCNCELCRQANLL